jgi:hypothetical protein
LVTPTMLGVKTVTSRSPWSATPDTSSVATRSPACAVRW